MNRIINEPLRIKEMWDLFNEVKLNPNEEGFNKVEKEIEYILSSNEWLKDYIISIAENIGNEYISYPVIVRKIKETENFTLVRFQDGEWTCMLKIEPHFENKVSKYGEEIGPLGDELLRIIQENPEYYISVNAGTFHERVGVVWEYIKDLKNLFVGEIFRPVSVERGLYDFFDVLSRRKVIVVGPEWLSNLSGFDFIHIKTPAGSVFKKDVVKDLKVKVGDSIENTKHDNPIVLYSCALPGKIMSHEFYGKYGNTITQIDMGAIFDPYCGKKTRPYHEKVIKRINLNK